MENLKAVEKNLQKLIDKYNLTNKLTVEMMKQWVYDENGSPLKAVHEFQDKCMKYFETDRIDNLNEILKAIMDAWNYFPHKTLGGKSPFQIAEDYKNKK